MLHVALVLAATSIAGIEDLVLAHPGDLEIPRLAHVLAPEDESGMSWRGIVAGGASGYGDQNMAGFGALGAEIAWGEADGARPSVSGGLVSADLSSWLAGASLEGRHALGARSTLQFRGSFAYQSRLIDEPFDSSDESFRFIVPITTSDPNDPDEVEVVLDDVTWDRYRIDASYARTLSQSGSGRTAIVLESGVHLTHYRFEGVNDEPLDLFSLLYPPGSYRTTQSAYVWSAPIGAFLAWRGSRIAAALGIRTDFQLESIVVPAGVTITI